MRGCNIKKTLILLFLIFSILACSSVAYAAPLGTLSYWEAASSTTQIGRYVNTLTISATTVSPNYMTQTNARLYTEAKMSQWGGTGGTPSTYNTYFNGAKIKIYIGHVDQVSAYVPNIAGNSGVTKHDPMTYVGYYLYDNIEKYLYNYSSSVVGVNCSVGYADTVDKQIHTIGHEMGHALGYAGHSPSTSHMMHETSWTAVNPTTADRRHIGQIH